MKNYKFKSAVLLLLLLVLFAGVMSGEPMPDTHVNVPATSTVNGKDAKQTGAIDVFRIVDGFLQKLPSDFDVSSPDFTTVFGAQTAQALQMLGATHISNHGGVIKLTLRQPYQHDLGKRADIKLDPNFSFKYERQENTVTITDIEGIQVKVSWFLGWMDFKYVKLVHDSAGNTALDATVHALFKDRDYHTVLGQDGKPLVTQKNK